MLNIIEYPTHNKEPWNTNREAKKNGKHKHCLIPNPQQKTNQHRLCSTKKDGKAKQVPHVFSV